MEGRPDANVSLGISARIVSQKANRIKEVGGIGAQAMCIAGKETSKSKEQGCDKGKGQIEKREQEIEPSVSK